MNARLDAMLGVATQNVEQALADGDVKTSTWFIEHLHKVRGTRLPKGLLTPLAGALEKLDDIETISRQSLLLAIDGDMTFEELKATQEALGRHANLAGMVELGRLREELEQLKEEAAAQPPVGMGHAPRWGRLLDRLNATDGDDDTGDNSQE